MANFIKLSNNTSDNFVDSQNFGKKFIANAKIPITIGSDATQNYESCTKIVSVSLPADRKLKILKAVFSYNMYLSVTETSSILFPMPDWAIPAFSCKQWLAISTESINNFYALSAGIPPSIPQISEKFYTMLPTEPLAHRSGHKIFNSELIATNKLSNLNIITEFFFPASMDDDNLKTLLLSYAKLNIDSSASAAAIKKFDINIQVDFEVYKPEAKVKPQKITVKKSIF